MSPHRQALIIIEQMRRYGITAPSQQTALLCIFQKPGITYDNIMSIMGASKETIAKIVKKLTSEGLIIYERPRKGFVREGKINLTDKGRKLLEIGGVA